MAYDHTPINHMFFSFNKIFVQCDKVINMYVRGGGMDVSADLSSAFHAGDPSLNPGEGLIG